MSNTRADRWILFGGSFDPIHNGHLGVAAFAKRQLNAERLFFVPASRSPHKIDPPKASEAQRLEMIRLAIKGMDGMDASDCEFCRPQPSFSVDTAREFRQRIGYGGQLF